MNHLRTTRSLLLMLGAVDCMYACASPERSEDGWNTASIGAGGLGTASGGAEADGGHAGHRGVAGNGQSTGGHGGAAGSDPGVDWSDATNLLAQLPGIRATNWYTWWGDTMPVASRALLERELPIMKSIGFNAVYMGFILTWRDLQPDPGNGVWDEDRVAELAAILQTIQDHGMRALFVLNTLGPGWAPDGIDPCSWGNDPTQVTLFTSYAEGLMTRLSTFAGMTYYMVYTEQSPACVPYDSAFYDEYAPTHEAEVASINQMLKSSIGRLPHELSPTVRSHVILGLHDNYLISENQAAPDAPMEDSHGFDFLSAVAYSPGPSVAFPGKKLRELSPEQLTIDLDARVANFQTIAPGIPMLLGEVGYDSCALADDANATWVTAVADWSASRAIGFNLWGWLPLFDRPSCLMDPAVEQFYALRPFDTELKSVVRTLQGRLVPEPRPAILMRSSYGYDDDGQMWVACDFGLAGLPCIQAEAAMAPCSFVKFSPERPTQAEFFCTKEQANVVKSGGTVGCGLFDHGDVAECKDSMLRVDGR